MVGSNGGGGHNGNGLLVDVGLGGDLLVHVGLSGDLDIDVGLGGDLLVDVGNDLRSSAGRGDKSENDLKAES